MRMRSNRFWVGLILLLLLLMPAIVLAVEVPPEGSTFFVQTNGPADPINDGDWFASSANGVGAGYHYFEVNVPCGWPSSHPIYFDLFSPMMYIANNGTDEPGAGGPYTTTFELYGLATTIRPSVNAPNQPGPGAPGSLLRQTFDPTASSEQWFRFYTLNPPVCGKYLLRAETHGADQNGWKLRVGWDSDSNPNNAKDPNYDNPDGLLGTNDDISIGIFQAAYQQDSGLTQCVTFYQFVMPNQTSVSFHNFDGDWDYICGLTTANCRIRYYGPSAAYDANAWSGGVQGTVSSNSVWNTGTTVNRGIGDVVNNPEAGWWRIVSCISHHNQFIQEGQTGKLLFYTQPNTPKVTIGKTDDLIRVGPSRVLTYTITLTNAVTSTPGAATNMRITDTLDLSMVNYQACGYVAPYSGTCSLVGNQIVFLPSGWLNPGDIRNIWVRVQTKSPLIGGAVINTVTVSYHDSMGNPFPDESAIDADLANPTAVTLSNFSVPDNSGALMRALLGATGLLMVVVLVWVYGRRRIK